MKITAPISEILRGKANQVWSIAPHAKVFDAIALMAEKNIGALPVVEAGRIIGILSERDYTRKVILHGKSSRETTVREIMTSPVTTVGPATSIDACMQLITQRRIRHLPVVADGRLTGMISIGDLVNWIISAQSAALEQMENYIHGGYAG
jgi:CBS domain-containing protein